MPQSKDERRAKWRAWSKTPKGRATIKRIKAQPANREKAAKRARKAHREGRTTQEVNRAFVTHLKESQPCADCGGVFPGCAMDFDHVRGKKLGTIAHLCSSGRKKLLDEIEKCDLVCANCHRIRTWLKEG